MHWLLSKISSLWQWSRSFPKRVTIPVAAIFLLLIFFAANKGADAYNYIQENPTFCRTCHTMQTAWDRWYTSEHRSVDCHSCHEVSPLGGAELVIKYALGRPENVSKHASVQDGVCESCHENNNPRWRQVADTAGHKVHAEEQNIACTTCHALSLHRFSPPGPLCRACHEEKVIKITGMAEQHCTTCHSYLADQNTLLPRREDCLRCHEKFSLQLNGQKVTWPADAPMQFACGQCHKPHEQAAPVVDCRSCHKDLGGLHLDNAAQRVQCQTCHRPHEWRISGVVRKEGPPVTPSPSAATPSATTPSATTPAVASPAAEAPTAAPTAVAAAPTAAAPKSPPAIPHSLEGRSDCLVCHSATGIKPFPANHAGRTKETCTACHATKQ